MIQINNKNIKINSQELKVHSKASEKYVDVSFTFLDYEWHGWIPVEYRRTGVLLSSDEDIVSHIENVYELMASKSINEWLIQERVYWDTEKSNAQVTRGFFDVLSEGGWKCRKHALPDNSNFARRIQDLKEYGYTLATDTKRYCVECGKKTTHIIMLPIPRVSIAGNGYETWSTGLRKRILKVLNNHDVYEGKAGQHLLPDHKFSEIRWDEDTKEENPDNMTDEQIRAKFQLLTNQRNQQKREACRLCFQTNKRQFPFGIKFYYEGDEEWNSTIPVRGKKAEDGCRGCGWYDMEKWRKAIVEALNKH